VITIAIASGADMNRAHAARAQIEAIKSTYLPQDHTPSPGSLEATYVAWRVGFITTDRSLLKLNAVLSRVTSTQAFMKDVGNHLVSWGLNTPRQAVSVGLDLITPVMSEDAQAKFGGWVVLETASPVTPA
jgi:hypothetical protein